jgi:hypothetical protein
MSEHKAWLDVALIRCPKCGHFYADASWYVIEVGADIECGSCHKNFNTQKHVVDRVMLEFDIDEKKRVKHVDAAKHV